MDYLSSIYNLQCNGHIAKHESSFRVGLYVPQRRLGLITRLFSCAKLS